MTSPLGPMADPTEGFRSWWACRTMRGCWPLFYIVNFNETVPAEDAPCTNRPEPGSPVPAMYAPVSDSGQARAHLVYGGDFGIRFRPSGSAGDWSLDDPDQWGEPYVVLTDENDILLDS